MKHDFDQILLNEQIPDICTEYFSCDLYVSFIAINVENDLMVPGTEKGLFVECNSCGHPLHYDYSYEWDIL